MKYIVFSTSDTEYDDDTDNWEHMIILNNYVELLTDFCISVSEIYITEHIEHIATCVFSNVCGDIVVEYGNVWKLLK